MKKALLLMILAAVCIFSSCSGGEPVGVTAPTEAERVEGTGVETGTKPTETVEASDSFVLGKVITASADSKFKLYGLRLDGETTDKDKNGRAPSMDGVRSEFALDEKIKFYFDSNISDISDEVRVICIKHISPYDYNEITYKEIEKAAVFNRELKPARLYLPNFTSAIPSSYDVGEYDILMMCGGEIAYITVIHLDEG